ncbi:MAG: diguanylate cyclase [Gemmatimonadales bacterium]
MTDTDRMQFLLDDPPPTYGLPWLVFRNARVGITVTGADRNIIMVNEAFTRVTGYPEEEVVGRNPRILQSGRHSPEFYREMWRALETRGLWQGEIYNKRRSGEIYPEWLDIIAIKDDAGLVTNYCAMFTDISERKAAEERLAFRAFHDDLTGLANRQLFDQLLEQALLQARRARRHAALLFIDFDGFKKVNDEVGHDGGDEVLRTMGERMRTVVRDSDVLARRSGDEFTLLLPEVGSARDAVTCAAKVREAVRQPIHIGEHPWVLDASLGIAIFPEDGATSPELLHVADQRMYSHKRRHLIRTGHGPGR